MEETLKEKYWKTGNIFVLSTGEKRLVWYNNLINANTKYIPKNFFNDNLVNTRSTTRECVTKIYSPYVRAASASRLLNVTSIHLLWEKEERFKVGDTVKLKDLNWYRENEEDGAIIRRGYSYSIVTPMNYYFGGIYKINEVCEEDGNVYYILDIPDTDIKWYFPDYCIEGKLETKNI